MEHFGHLMEVAARTAADAVGEGLVRPEVKYMTVERAREKECRAILESRPTAGQ